MKRNLLKIMFAVVALFGATAVSAKTVKAKIFVNGKCDHCKERIEKTALDIKGVSAAVWNQQNKQLLLKYNPEKTDTVSIEKALVKVGHDAGNFKATDNAYNALPACCHYDRK